MRKKLITDMCFRARHTTSTLGSVLKQGILRKIKYSEEYVNPVTHKLANPRLQHDWGATPDGNSPSSFVVINDSRTEIAQIGKRGLITSTLIFEELLNCNRGEQNYEYERNKFFIQDTTTNATDIHNSRNIVLLDILWYMAENNVDAVEIEMLGERVDRSDVNFMSKRYRDIVNRDIKQAKKTALKLAKPFYEAMVDRFKKDDGATVKWSEASYYRDWHFEGMKEYSGHNPIQDILRNYYSYRQDTDDKPAKRFASYVNDVLDEGIEDTTIFSTEDYVGMIARNFNYVSIPDINYFTGIAFNKRIKYEWKKVADSKFKRNIDWHLDEGNFIKSEVLKLRRQLEEGTFNE